MHNSKGFGLVSQIVIPGQTGHSQGLGNPIIVRGGA